MYLLFFYVFMFLKNMEPRGRASGVPIVFSEGPNPICGLTQIPRLPSVSEAEVFVILRASPFSTSRSKVRHPAHLRYGSAAQSSPGIVWQRRVWRGVGRSRYRTHRGTSPLLR